MPIIWLCMTYGNICELEQAKYVAFYYVRDTVLPSETIVCTEGVRGVSGTWKHVGWPRTRHWR